MKLEICQQIFEKHSNIKFYENPPSESQVVPGRWTDMMKLIVTFRTFANIPKNLKSRSLILRFFVLWFFYTNHFTIACGICGSHGDIKADFSPSTTVFSWQ